MSSNMTLSFSSLHEEWADTDFDIPEDIPFHTRSDAESDNEVEDWDLEMNLERTSKFKPLLSFPPSQLVNIRPAIASMESLDEDDDCDDEGASTIKLSHMPAVSSQTTPQQLHQRLMDDDIETAFELPADLSKLSLRPLHHRLSKTSFEWGDRDHTSSSTSSDAYSSFGFGPSASPSSNSTAPSTVGDSDLDDDEDHGELDGLVLPDGLFESGNSGIRLAKILESKKQTAHVEDRPKPAHFESEEDFEMGLVIDDDIELSPSRLPSNRAQAAEEKKILNRSKSAPPRPPVAPFRPSSRLGTTKERSKSPTFPPSASTRTLRPLAMSPTTTSRPSLTRKSTFQAISSALQSIVPSSSSASGPLRAQKSQCVLKQPSPRSDLIRKGSLSSLIDIAAAVAGPSSASAQSPTSYAAPTVASRARTQKSQTTHRHAQAPVIRPSTPNGTPVGIRLTMPTSSSRAKIRPAISSVFGNMSSNKEDRTSPVHASSSRPSSIASSSSLRSHTTSSIPQPVAPHILRRPKRVRTYGDGTELDGIEDLPIDREREKQYRVVPRGTGAPRLGTNSKKSSPEKERLSGSEKENKGTISRRHLKPMEAESKPASTTSTLRRKDRIDLGSTLKPPNEPGTQPQTRKVSRRKLPSQTPSSLPLPTTRRKPTLIRNLGGHSAPKVVGDMKWNPQTLRWEGNEHALRDFDAVTSSSIRPALITHLTGSSIGSPVGAGSLAAAGARVVGNMIFDPTRMCWISRLPPEEDEPDVFAGFDEDDEWESRGGTIRANTQPTLDENAHSRGETPSPRRPQSQAHNRAMSESGSERGSRPTLHLLQDIDGKLLKKCRDAELRHRVEMKGWRLPASEKNEPNINALYEIRALATRQY